MAGKAPVAISGVGTAPAKATVEYYKSRPRESWEEGDNVSPIPAQGVRAAIVPGVFDGLILALDKYGTMSFAQVAAPAIELIAFVAERYPDKLAAGVTREERIANMEFLRDRIIEFGICGGMDIGWNMKRGGPEKSKDFVAWHNGRRRMGVDIAYAYDAPTRQLQLVWAVYGPTKHYRAYEPRPRCKSGAQ